MLIASQCQAFDDPDYIYELKMDGFRCLAYIEPGKVDLRNKRNMKMLDKFPELGVNALLGCHDLALSC